MISFNEITAIPALLKLLELKDCIVTIDAMGCQKEIAQVIRDNDADYVLALKANHKRLYDDVRLFLDKSVKEFGENEGENFDYHETLGGNHGRIEIRRYWLSHDIDWLEQKGQWYDLKNNRRC